MSWQRAVELQRLLFRVAGPPDCRKASQANLEDAKEWAAYVRTSWTTLVTADAGQVRTPGPDKET